MGRNFEKIAKWDFENIDYLDEKEELKLFYFVWMSNIRVLRKPYWIFEKNFLNLNLEEKAINVYSRLKSKNYKFFISLLKELRDDELSRFLKNIVLNHLDVLSDGIEEIK